LLFEILLIYKNSKYDTKFMIKIYFMKDVKSADEDVIRLHHTWLWKKKKKILNQI